MEKTEERNESCRVNKKRSSHLLKKFENLKRRRTEISAASSSTIAENISEQDDTKEGIDSQSKRKKSSVKTETSVSYIPEKEWEDTKKYMGAHDHLKGTDPGKYAAKSNLERKIDEAIKEGQFELAEKLSDNLSNREFGKKITEAIDAQRFDNRTREEKTIKDTKKKKKLDWGFEQKERWETKGNM